MLLPQSAALRAAPQRGALLAGARTTCRATRLRLLELFRLGHSRLHMLRVGCLRRFQGRRDECVMRQQVNLAWQPGGSLVDGVQRRRLKPGQLPARPLQRVAQIGLHLLKGQTAHLLPNDNT